MSDAEALFVTALNEHASRFDLNLSEDVATELVRYFRILQLWNPRLHLVAPCSPEEFAVRHVLESLMAVNLIPPDSKVIDIGSGGGFPIIPCLIARPDISATLFETSSRKAVFIREAIRAVGINDRANVVAASFDSEAAPIANVVTCRALDRFTDLIASIVDWSPMSSRLLLFGGPSLQVEIEKTGLPYTANRIPESNQRFLFVVEK